MIVKGNLVDRATEFAVLAHEGGVRKGTSTPYVIHPVGVGLILAKYGCDEEVIAAGLLHDVDEDTDYTIEDIRARFGDRIADIVEGCSECKANTWGRRKVHTILTLPTASRDVQMVGCADKLHNLRAIVSDFQTEGEDLWKRFNRGRMYQEWYYRGVSESLISSPIEDGEFPELFETFRREVEEFFGKSHFQKMTLKELKAAHQTCYSNRELISKSDTCGCFYCLDVYSADLVCDWGDDDNGNPDTAVCPKCHVDAIIPSATEYPLNPEFLQQMHEHWFSL